MEYTVYLNKTLDVQNIMQWLIQYDLDFTAIDAYHFVVENIHFISK